MFIAFSLKVAWSGKIPYYLHSLQPGPVFEINGALSTRRAHFDGRAHVFRTCAPDVCTFFHSIIIAIYQRKVHGKNPGRIVSKCMHMRGAQNKRLISNTEGCDTFPTPHLSSATPTNVFPASRLFQITMW